MSKNVIFITPGPSNPEGAEKGHWKIMFTENGRTRHLNDAKDHTEAVVKAERTAAKRGVEVDLDHPKFAPAATPEVEEEFDGPSYLRTRRPRGAPNIGQRVKLVVNEEEYELEVEGYLSEQFYGNGRIVHVNEDWSPIA